MYSFEIENLLKERNYVVDSETYMHICKTSPQIVRIVFNKDNSNFYIHTNDNYNFELKVYLEK